MEKSDIYHYAQLRNQLAVASAQIFLFVETNSEKFSDSNGLRDSGDPTVFIDRCFTVAFET